MAGLLATHFICCQSGIEKPCHVRDEHCCVFASTCSPAYRAYSWFLGHETVELQVVSMAGKIVHGGRQAEILIPRKAAAAKLVM